MHTPGILRVWHKAVFCAGNPFHLGMLVIAAFASNHFAAFARKKTFHAKAAKSKNAKSAKKKVHQSDFMPTLLPARPPAGALLRGYCAG